MIEDVISTPTVSAFEGRLAIVPPVGQGRMRRSETSRARATGQSSPVEADALPRGRLPPTVQPEPVRLWSDLPERGGNNSGDDTGNRGRHVPG